MNVILWAWRTVANGVRAEIRGWDTAKAIIAEEIAKTPGPAASPPPVPGHDCGPVHAGIGFNRNGCLFVWEPASGCWQHRQHRQPFDVGEWEQRLAAGPRDGESLAEWQRRIEP